jgi:hypothetical protein
MAAAGPQLPALRAVRGTLHSSLRRCRQHHDRGLRIWRRRGGPAAGAGLRRRPTAQRAAAADCLDRPRQLCVLDRLSPFVFWLALRGDQTHLRRVLDLVAVHTATRPRSVIVLTVQPFKACMHLRFHIKGQQLPDFTIQAAMHALTHTCTHLPWRCMIHWESWLHAQDSASHS